MPFYVFLTAVYTLFASNYCFAILYSVLKLAGARFEEFDSSTSNI